MVRDITLIWDEWNLNHIAKHGVSRREVEEAIKDNRKRIRKHRRRYVIVASAWGRILSIVLERIQGNEYYVITARDATTSEKKIYRSKRK